MLLSFFHFYNIKNSRLFLKSEIIPRLLKVTISAAAFLKRKFIWAYNLVIVANKYQIHMLD